MISRNELFMNIYFMTWPSVLASNVPMGQVKSVKVRRFGLQVREGYMS